MGKQIFAYKTTVKLTKKQLAQLGDAGYLPIKVELLSDIQVLAAFPEVDDTWLLSTAMDCIFENGYGVKTKFGEKIMTHLRNRLDEPAAKGKGE